MLIFKNLDFEFSLEESFLGVELAQHQVHQVVVADGQGHVSLAWSIAEKYTDSKGQAFKCII